eukprot:UN23713
MGMQGADLCIFQKDENESWFATDTFSEGFYEPKADFLQNCHLMEVTETDDQTIILYNREIETCDNSDINLELKETNGIIWAFGVRNTIGYHGTLNRGYSVISF